MEKEKIKRYIYSQIENGRFSFLSPNISSGIIYKIPSPYNLVEHNFEIAYLYLREGSLVFLHEHLKDIERYKCIEGILSINGERVEQNIFKKNKRHSIDRVPEDTIIETFKITEDYLLQNKEQEITSNTFEKVLRKHIIGK